MDRSDLSRTLRQINGRTRLAVDLSEVEINLDQLDQKTEGLSNSLLAAVERVDGLSNRVDQAEDDIAALSNRVDQAEDDIAALSNRVGQAEDDIAALAQDLDDVLPDWVTVEQENVSLSAFGGSLDYTRLTNAPDLLTPAWVDPVQGNVSLSAFGGDLGLSRVVLPPVVDNSSLAQTTGAEETSIDVTIGVRLQGAEVINPSWVKGTQAEVQLSAFGGPLEYTRLINAPDPSVSWDEVTDKPAWTTLIDTDVAGRLTVPTPAIMGLVAVDDATNSVHAFYCWCCCDMRGSSSSLWPRPRPAACS